MWNLFVLHSQPVYRTQNTQPTSSGNQLDRGPVWLINLLINLRKQIWDFTFKCFPVTSNFHVLKLGHELWLRRDRVLTQSGGVSRWCLTEGEKCQSFVLQLAEDDISEARALPDSSGRSKIMDWQWTAIRIMLTFLGLLFLFRTTEKKCEIGDWFKYLFWYVWWIKTDSRQVHWGTQSNNIIRDFSFLWHLKWLPRNILYRSLNIWDALLTTSDKTALLSYNSSLVR